jgi:hypothetical protein
MQLKVLENCLLRYSVGSNTGDMDEGEMHGKRRRRGGINVLKVGPLLHRPSWIV